MEAVTATGDMPDLWVVAPADVEASQHNGAGVCQWRTFPPCLLKNGFRRTLGDGYAGCGIRGQAMVKYPKRRPRICPSMPRPGRGAEYGWDGAEVIGKRETQSSDLAVHGKLRYFTRKTSRRAKQPQEKSSYSTP